MTDILSKNVDITTILKSEASIAASVNNGVEFSVNVSIPSSVVITPDWGDIPNKPFNSIAEPLEVKNGALSFDTLTVEDLSKILV